MQKKVMPIIIGCFVIPYIIMVQFIPINTLGKYVKHYTDSLLFSAAKFSQEERIVDVSSPVPPFSNEMRFTRQSDNERKLPNKIFTPIPRNQNNYRFPLRNNKAAENVSLSDSPNMKYEDKTVDGHQKNVPALASRRKYNIRPGRNSSADSSKSASSVPRLKKILFWNKVSDNIKVRTRYKNYGLGSGQRIFLEFGCPFNACTVTGSRKRFAFKDLDAIVWNQRSKDRSFPPVRFPHTRYVFMLMEPPGHVKRKIKRHTNIFNWTLTYRWDSDIPMRIGQVLPKRDSKAVVRHHNYAAGKNKMAAWFVSNCGSDSGRGQLAKELQKYFPVDIFGKCGPYKCPRFAGIDCYERIEKQYKFYLSFENSLCRDYVTEKFFNVLQYNIVPVVYGGADYSSIAPKKSYINAREFPSVAALARYLLYLSSNDTAYNEYFWWKSHYKVLNASASKSLAWCHLCERLHQDNRKKSYKNIYDWFMKEAKCETRKLTRIKRFIEGHS